ncbi:MAG: polysaccharide biosynthesis C-terminal domain-containing protein [Candidatus Riflebacteria bacterium]|nr:polysaccharide biosynthesis C-terminal domain-containing protein [Candidatus Riflebacteria bacterium]
MTVVAAAHFAVLLVMTHWQVQGRAFPFGVFQILQTVVNLGLSVWLVVSWGHGWRGRVEAQVVTALAFAGAGMVVLARDGWLRYSYSRQDVREAIRFGLPLVPHELGSTLIAQTDRLFIANIVSLADAGVYSVAYQLTSIIELVAASFNQAFSPWLFRMLAQRPSLELLRVIVKYTYVCFAVMAGFALTVALLLPYVLSHVVGDAFAGAARFTPWLAIGFMFSGMYYLVANYIFFAKRTELIPLITVSCALVNLGLNAVLVPRNGAVGAAQASAAALALSFVGTWYLSTRAYKMPWSLKRC